MSHNGVVGTQTRAKHALRGEGAQLGSRLYLTGATSHCGRVTDSLPPPRLGTIIRKRAMAPHGNHARIRTPFPRGPNESFPRLPPKPPDGPSDNRRRTLAVTYKKHVADMVAAIRSVHPTRHFGRGCALYGCNIS